MSIQLGFLIVSSNNVGSVAKKLEEGGRFRIYLSAE